MSEQLPWEGQWGFDEWVEWEPSETHRTWVSDGVYWCGTGNSPNGDGMSRDEAARDSARRWCREVGCALPFRPRPDLSTVEGCIRAITEAGGTIHFLSGEMPHGCVWVCVGSRGRYFGQVGQPWSLADLQATARYVLGIEE